MKYSEAQRCAVSIDNHTKYGVTKIHSGQVIYTLCSKKKHTTTFSMITWSRTVRLQRFLAFILPRVYAINRYF